MKSTKLRPLQYLVSCKVKGLYTNALVDKVLKTIMKKITENDNPPPYNDLLVDGVVELLGADLFYLERKLFFSFKEIILKDFPTFTTYS